MVKFYPLFLILSIISVISLNAQSIQSVNPSTAQKGELMSVTISGQSTNFMQISSSLDVMLFQTGFTQGTPTIIPTSITVNSDNELVADFRIPNCFPNGDYAVGLYNDADGFLTLEQALTLGNDPTPPAITSVSPSNGVAGNTLNVTISGQNTNFLQVTNTYQVLFNQITPTLFDQLVFEPSYSGLADQIWFSQASPTGFDQLWFGQMSSTYFFPHSINVVNNTTLQANITIPDNLAYGNYTVTIYNHYDCIIHKFNTYGVSNPNDPNDPNYTGTGVVEEDLLAGGSMSLYPNPFTDALFIENKQELSAEIEIRIIDSKGISVFTKKVNNPLTKLDVPFLEPGIYNILINRKGKQYSKRIVKE